MVSCEVLSRSFPRRERGSLPRVRHSTSCLIPPTLMMTRLLWALLRATNDGSGIPNRTLSTVRVVTPPACFCGVQGGCNPVFSSWWGLKSPSSGESLSRNLPGTNGSSWAISPNISFLMRSLLPSWWAPPVASLSEPTARAADVRLQ